MTLLGMLVFRTKPAPASSPYGQHDRVTGSLSPHTVEIVEDSFKPGSIKLHFTDSSGRRHRFFPITDLGFYDYAQRHRDSGSLAALNIEVARQEAVFLRVGLSRKFKSPQGKELGALSEDRSCYLDGRVQYGRLAQTPLFHIGP